MKYCTDKVSRKIKVLSFWAMVSVVLIHSNSFSGIVSPSEFTVLFDHLRYFLTMWAVPFFFMVSGFFFSRYLEQVDNFSYRELMAGKWHKLIVPYLLWGGVYGVLLGTPILVWVASRHGEPYLSRSVFANGDPLVVLERVFGVFGSAPANGALWYVRMLIIFFVFAPVWRFLQLRCRYLLLLSGLPLAVLLGVAGREPDVIIPLGKLHLDLTCGAIGYLLLGMFVAVKGLEEREFRAWQCFGLAVLASVSYMLRLPRYCTGTIIVVIVWSVYDVLPCRLPKDLPWFFGLTFWVYCMHHCLTSYVGAGIRTICGTGEFSYYAQFVMTPLFVIGGAAILGRMCRINFPRAFGILNGGR